MKRNLNKHSRCVRFLMKLQPDTSPGIRFCGQQIFSRRHSGSRLSWSGRRSSGYELCNASSSECRRGRANRIVSDSKGKRGE